MQKSRLILIAVFTGLLVVSVCRVILSNPKHQIDENNINQVLAYASDDEVEEAMRSDKDRIRSAAIAEFSKRNPHRCALELGPFLKDDSYHVRATAISSLSNAGNGDISDNIQDIIVCLNDDELIVRQRAFMAVQQYMGLNYKFDFGPQSNEAKRRRQMNKIRADLRKHNEHISSYYAARKAD